MRTPLPRSIAQLVVPEGLLLLVAVVLFQWAPVRGSIAGAAPLFAFTVFGGGALLAWRFHRGRVVFALVTLSIAAIVIQRAPPTADPDAVERWTTVFRAVAVLLPLNLLLLTMLGERGVFTTGGIARLMVLLGQVVGVVIAMRTVPDLAAAWLGRSFVGPIVTGWTPVGDLGLVAYLATAVWLTVQLVLRPSASQRGYLWALVASFLALHGWPDHQMMTAYLGTAGLVLGVGVIEATYFMAFRDHLTGLPARRAFNSALLQLGTQYCVAMVDVDRFKKFNDTHGHAVGDQVLKMVASRLQEVGGGGTAYRYGGEEFAILFPGRRRDDCLAHLEEVRQAVEASTFGVRGRRRPRKTPTRRRSAGKPGRHLSVTVSIGVAERNGRYVTPDKVVKAADRALYRAKKAGRNRIRR